MNYIYVDNFGLLVEARRVSSVAKGLAKNIHEALNYQIVDPYYLLDFGKLHLFIERKIGPAAKTSLFGLCPGREDSLWEVARKSNFEIIQAGNSGEGKKVDAEIATAMLKDAYQKADPAKDSFTLVAGEGDFKPALVQLKSDGFCVDVIFWDHLSRELKNCAFRSIYLNPYLEHLEYKNLESA